MSSTTRFDRAVKRLKNHRALVGVLLLAFCVTGLGQVAAGIESIRDFWEDARKGSVEEEAKLKLLRRGRVFSKSDFLAAIRSGNRDISGLYLQAGISPNTKNPEGGGAIYLAAAYCREDIIDLLVDYGARVDDRNELNHGTTPLLIATVKCETIEPAVHLLQRGGDPNLEGILSLTPFTAAVLKGNALLVRAMIKHGADVNHHHSFQGRTPLMEAARKGNQEIVRVLLDAGAILSARDDSGRSASDWAESQEVKDLLAFKDSEL